MQIFPNQITRNDFLGYGFVQNQFWRIQYYCLQVVLIDFGVMSLNSETFFISIYKF